MKAKGPIVLASASPRRAELLGHLSLGITVKPSEIAEVGYGGDPALIPLRMATQKAKSVLATLGPSFDGWVIAADTIVALEREVFGKPQNDEDARRILGELSGKTHQVYTGYRIQGFDGDVREETVCTDVEMVEMSPADIDWYVKTGEPNDKAGAYAIQGIGGRFVKRISGSYTNVVGLPLLEVTEALYELEAIVD